MVGSTIYRTLTSHLARTRQTLQGLNSYAWRYPDERGEAFEATARRLAEKATDLERRLQLRYSPDYLPWVRRPGA